MTNVVLKWSKSYQNTRNSTELNNTGTAPYFILHRVHTAGGRANDAAGTDNVYSYNYKS